MHGISLRALLSLLVLTIFPAQSTSQLVPQWLVTGRGQFTNPKTVTGIAGCGGGYYLTGGMIDNDFLLQISDDGGLTWETTLQLKRYGFGQIQPPMERPFAEVFISSVARPTPAACFAYGWGSNEFEGSRFPILLRSLDSGRTWIDVALPDSAQGINDACLAMRDAMHGIRNGGYIDDQHSVLYRTSDGGDSWSIIGIPFVDYRTKWLSYAKDGTMFALEWRTDPPLYRSTDNGDTWELQGTLPNHRTPCFVTADLGWIAYGTETGQGNAERDVIARTTDGGASWVLQHDSLQDPPFGLIAIDAADERHIIAVGREGKLLHSVDGGLNWETAARPFFLYDPACVEVAYPDTASAVAGALFHIVTYAGTRTLQPPVVTCSQGLGTLQRTAQWTQVDGATQYQLELAEDYHTSTIQFEIFETQPYKQSGWLSTTSLALDSWLRLNRDYFIRVRARGGVYTSDWSWPIKIYTEQTTNIAATAPPSGISLSLYPQPAVSNAEFRARGLQPDAAWQLYVYDMLGRMLFASEGRSDATGVVGHMLALGHVPSGLLIVRFRCGDELRALPMRVLR